VIKITLSEDEKNILGNYFKTSTLKLLRLKSQAVLMRDKKLKYQDISDLLFKDPRTIKRWIKDFSKIRLASIFTGHKDNENASKLTKEQKQEIAEVLSKPPSDYDLPKEFWDVPILKEYIQVKFETIYESKQSYYFLLKFSKLSFKYPDTFDIKRDEELITKRIKEIKLEIDDYFNNKDWEIFVSDEVRIMLEAITRKAWLKKGERTIIKVKRSGEYQSYIGLLNQKTFKCNLYELAWQNQEEIIKALKKFLELYPDKRICIVWDNAGFHKGKLIQAALKKDGVLERVHLINFPPYAPDHNPIEHIWKEAKQKISNIQFNNFEKTKEAFVKEITGRKFKYQM